MEFPCVLVAEPPVPNMWFVAAMGMITVLLGLICIIILCTLMSKICGSFSSKTEDAAPAPAPAVAPAAAPVPATAPAAIPNRGELIAAVTAAIAEEMGTDVSAIRVRSFKQIGASAPAANPARAELVAAVSAAVAEELGTDVSRIRIHSLKKIG